MSISYTQHKGKKGLTYSYWIADHTGSLTPSKSGILIKKLAKESGEFHKSKIEEDHLITEDITLYKFLETLVSTSNKTIWYFWNN